MNAQGSSYSEEYYPATNYTYKSSSPKQESSSGGNEAGSAGIQAGGSLLAALMNSWAKKQQLNRQRKYDSEQGALSTQSQAAALGANTTQSSFGDLMGQYRSIIS